MKMLQRVIQKFKRHGIGVTYAGGVYTVQNENACASILLPEDFVLEERAVIQLLDFASVGSAHQADRVCKACATPDFHPGGIAPVGAIVATDADFVIPAAIGTDINCGMRLITTGISHGYAMLHKEKLVQSLKRVLLESGRDVPMMGKSFAELFDLSLPEFISGIATKGMWSGVNKQSLVNDLNQCVGLENFRSSSRYAPEALLAAREIRDPCLGTPGGGNHFVELQVVEELYDKTEAYQRGIKKDDVVVMLHSGSRDVGFFVGHRWMDRAKEAWPKGIKHPESGLYGLEGDLAKEYLVAMGTAARYAWLNRVVLGEMVKAELERVVGLSNSQLVVDVPHNVVLQENGLNVHRKGATPAHAQDLVIIPGSMGTASYLASGLGNQDWLSSCSHGAGRSIRRQATRRKIQTHEQTSWECVTLREERKIEEAPEAYKAIGPVIEAQETAGMISSIAKLRPWVTFKA
jgi:tRNA-splicing ligase RtcB